MANLPVRDSPPMTFPYAVRAWYAVLAALLAIALSACSKPSADDMVVAAQRHIAEHNLPAARIELRNAIQAAPKHAVAHRLLGATLLRLGDPATAEVALRQSLALHEKPDDVLPNLALALLRQGQAQKLIDEFANTTLQDPAAHAALRAHLGQAWLLRAEVRPAAEAFAAALAAQPGHAVALLGQARIAARDGKLDDAAALTDAALRTDARQVEAHAFKSQLLMAQGQRQQAIVSLEQALALDAGYLPARLALASILIDANDHEKAKAVLGAAGPAGRDPQVQFLQSLLALRQGDLSTARDAVLAVLKAKPEHGAALALAGEIEFRAGSHALAEQHLGQAMRLQATPGVRRLLAATQLRLNRSGKALETLQPLLQDGGPKDAALVMLAGEAHLANGDLRRAGEYFEAAKAAGASEALARTRLGQMAATQGDFERAVQELQAASSMEATRVEPDLLLVSLHLRRQQPAQALAAAQAFIQKQPQNPVGHVLAGTAQALLQDRAAARRSLEAALKIKADHVSALRALADLDVTEGKPADAQRRYDALLAKKADDEQLLVAAAALQERTGRTDESVKTLRKAIAAHPRAREPFVALIQHHLRRKDAAQALEVAQEAVRNNPDELDLAVMLGVAQEAAGANKDAIRTLNALVLRQPHAAPALVRLAQLQARQRDFDGAVSTLLRAREKAPHNDGVTRDLAMVYLQAGKTDEAVKVAKDLQARQPEAAAGHLLEGDVRTHAKKWIEAERAYRAALKLAPRDAVAAGKTYRVLLAAGKKKEADDFASDWITRQPADASMRLLVADAALRARNFQVAIGQYEDVLRSHPDQPIVLNNLAWALGQTKDPKALGVAERAAALAPGSAEVLDTLGMLHLQSGDAKRGLEVLQRARELAPDRPDLRLHYAKGLLRNGRAQEGKAQLRELAAANADFPGKADIAALLATP
jgi:putative PEP-CTERM system TPR-repeat lipoprotein